MEVAQTNDKLELRIVDLLAQQPMVVGDARLGFMAVEAPKYSPREKIAIAWTQDYKFGLVGDGRYGTRNDNCYIHCDGSQCK